MPDETRRAIVTAGMAGAAAALAPWGRPGLGRDAGQGGRHGRDAAHGRAPGLLRPPGERLRRGGLRRPGDHVGAGAPRRGGDREDRRDPIPPDAHHLVPRDVLRLRADDHADARPGHRRDPHGGALPLPGGRPPRRPPPRVRARRRHRRLPPAPGGRRRPNPSPDGGPRGPGRAEGHRACGRERRPRGDRAHGRDRGPDRRRGARRRHALDAPRQRLCADAAPPPERDLGAARQTIACSPASSSTATTCRRPR